MSQSSKVIFHLIHFDRPVLIQPHTRSAQTHTVLFVYIDLDQLFLQRGKCIVFVLMTAMIL